MKREKGFYWVQLGNDRWVVCEWTGHYFLHLGVGYQVQYFKKIDERKIIQQPF